MQNYLLYLKSEILRLLEEPNKYTSNIFSHLENLLVYPFLFWKLSKMLLVDLVSSQT